MRRTHYFPPFTTVFYCSLFTLLNVCLLAHNSLGKDQQEVILEKNSRGLDFSSVEIRSIETQNIKRAHELIDKLYTNNAEDFTQLFGSTSNPLVFMEAGTQAGYYAKPGTPKADGPLVLYKRTWIYDAGIALSLAIQNRDTTIDDRALWLLKYAQYTRDPENPSEIVFAGWNFSRNQSNYGDDWTDCRFVTGANCHAILAIAEYITSENYQKLKSKFRVKFSELYANALLGILYLMEQDGPNAQLITAGWTLNVLEEFYETNHSYNKILELLGYGPKQISGYDKKISRFRAMNIVMEHNIDALKVLNYTLANYGKLFRKEPPYSYHELNAIRLRLRDSMFEKFYNEDKKCFITGRSASGEPSPYTAIDNASWFTLALNLEELNPKQVEALSNSLVYTIKNFTKGFRINGKMYFGAHYFEDGFEDPYIEKSELHSSALHVEATCGLICGLLQFSNTFPNHPNALLFRATAEALWKNLQHFLNDHGFLYASASLRDVTEPTSASVSAIWYLRTLNYLKDTRSI